MNYEQFLQQKDLLLKKKISSWRERLIEMLRDGLLERLLNERLPEEEIARLAAEIAEHKRDPYSLVEEIVGELRRTCSPRRHGGTEKRKGSSGVTFQSTLIIFSGARVRRRAN